MEMIIFTCANMCTSATPHITLISIVHFRISTKPAEWQRATVTYILVLGHVRSRHRAVNLIEGSNLSVLTDPNARISAGVLVQANSAGEPVGNHVQARGVVLD